ncbi:uncharacterized protein FOMMEDRAFT_95305, partial [Fomitiporia mediterranea MF3/22]|uniref:uncharacterized protein n=1 Tax=Fomitiporia mediterranea (strain MF3/22) TaxID=694068 RepID=UPI00044094C5
LCTNRDEYLSRPTVNAHFHSFGRESIDNFVLSGRDLQAGGSWFGINRVGRVALLTNISEEVSVRFRESRGHLVSSFLLPEAQDKEHCARILANNHSAEYAGFNILVLTPSSDREDGSLAYEALLITNCKGGGAITGRTLYTEERRVGGVSNGVDSVNGRSWPKVKTGEACLAEVLYKHQGTPARLSEDELVERLFGILSKQTSPPPNNRFQLRTSIEIPPLRMSGSLSPDARPADGHNFYGTRLSTVLLVRRDGRVLFIERDVWRLDDEGNAVRGDPRKERVFRFRLDGHGQD